MSSRSKSPLHPSALSLNNITPGRRIILFNLEYGVLEEASVVSRPYVDRKVFEGYTSTNFAVDLRSVAYGTTRKSYLADMGVIPYSGSSSGPGAFWNNRNFTIDTRKRHLLSEPDPSLHDFAWDELDRWIEEVYDYDL